jgi:hypothetical protein
MTTKPQAGRPRGVRRRPRPNGTMVMLTTVTLIAALFIALPTVTLFAVGMVPTVVAYIVDLSPGRYACRCVASLNFAGVFPHILKLWTTGHHMTGALKVAADPYAWLVMFSAAGLGWLLFIGVPGVSAALQSLNAKRTVESLKQRQRELV